MFQPKLSRSIGCFGIKWIDKETRKYQITHEEEALISSVKDMVASGFDAIELMTLGPWNRQEELENYPYVTRAVEIIKDHGLYLNSVHLPFSCQLWNFTSLDENERKLSVESVKSAVSFYEKDMPNCFVIHPDTRPKDDSERSARLEQLTKSMYEICEFVPAKVCVENMTNNGMLNVSSEAEQLLSAVPKLYMTLDINHPLTQAPESYIKAIGDRIKNVHVSDRDHDRECHYVPGKGVLNWDNIMNALNDIGYTGMLTYEVSPEIPSKEIKDNYDWLLSKVK
ncbi:MAG: sugar phosphate isomerase/epimerase [Clostridia bacterium]|nr:sugar phosphate isomerase/epimerase [Clostridia bacterium]